MDVPIDQADVYRVYLVWIAAAVQVLFQRQPLLDDPVACDGGKSGVLSVRDTVTVRTEFRFGSLLHTIAY
jgi:hypothetical protein